MHTQQNLVKLIISMTRCKLEPRKFTDFFVERTRFEYEKKPNQNEDRRVERLREAKLQRLYTFGNTSMVRQIETDVLMQRWWLSSTQSEAARG